MEERGRGQLDLTAVGELAVERDNLPQEGPLLVQKPLLLIFGVTAPLGFEFGELGVLLKQNRVHPAQVRPDLEVTQIALAEPRQRLLARIDPQSALDVEFMIAWMGSDHGVGVGHEEVVDQVEGVLVCQAVAGEA